MVNTCLILIFSNIIRAMAYHIEPIKFYSNSIVQRIKDTSGITGLYSFKVLINSSVWHIDVDSTCPRAVVGFKGLAVRQLKGNVSWVENVEKQFGSYLL